LTSHPPWKQRYAPHIGLTAPDAPLLLHSAGSADPVAQINHIAGLGFAGIEDNFLKVRPVADQERIGAALARHGLAMGCFVNNPMHWNRPLWGNSGEDARAQLRHDLEQSIVAAGLTGGRALTVVSASDPAMPLGYQRAAMVENLKRCGDLAAKAGLVLALETVDSHRWPGMLLHHIDDAYAVVKAVASPAVKLVFDIGHVHPMDGEVIANLHRCWDEIAVIQVADNPGRLELGSGELNWINIFRVIRQKNYAGLIELEHLLTSPGLEGEHAMLASLRAIDAAL
jgi:hydroxypyruvate isomerase